jgi:hypothetical protein
LAVITGLVPSAPRIRVNDLPSRRRLRRLLRIRSIVAILVVVRRVASFAVTLILRSPRSGRLEG